MTKHREFPALLMTTLIIGAALATTVCLRKMTNQPRQGPVLSHDTHYYIASPSMKFAQDATTYETPATTR